MYMIITSITYYYSQYLMCYRANITNFDLNIFTAIVTPYLNYTTWLGSKAWYCLPICGTHASIMSQMHKRFLRCVAFIIAFLKICSCLNQMYFTLQSLRLHSFRHGTVVPILIDDIFFHCNSIHSREQWSKYRTAIVTPHTR